jgi:hypothetical protein
MFTHCTDDGEPAWSDLLFPVRANGALARVTYPGAPHEVVMLAARKRAGSAVAGTAGYLLGD